MIEAEMIVSKMINRRDPMLPTKAFTTKDKALADAVAEVLDRRLGCHVKIEDSLGYTLYSFGVYQRSCPESYRLRFEPF